MQLKGEYISYYLKQGVVNLTNQKEFTFYKVSGFGMIFEFNDFNNSLLISVDLITFTYFNE